MVPFNADRLVIASQVAEILDKKISEILAGDTKIIERLKYEFGEELARRYLILLIPDACFLLSKDFSMKDIEEQLKK